MGEPASGTTDKEISDAFVASPNNLSYTQTDDEKKTTKLFLLKDKMYYDLQKYLDTGIGLPMDRPHFESQYPRTYLTKLTEIDANVYGQLETTFTNIYSHTFAFQHDQMPKFSTISHNIVTYCDDVSRYMTGKGLLQDTVNSLAIPDDSTSPAPLTSTQFDAAKKRVKVILGILAKRAAARQQECSDFVKDLDAFKQICIVDQTDVEYLNHQFNVGKPVYVSKENQVDSGNPLTYSDRLNTRLGQLNRDMNGLQNDISNEENERQNDIVIAGTAATYAVIFPAGTIAAAVVMGVYGAKAEGLKAEIANNQAALAADQAEANALSQTIQMVQMLKSCVTDLENTIQKAIDALSGMSKTFGQQAADLTSIATNWDQVQQGADTSDIDDRTLTMQTAIDGAKSAWAELKILALDFITNAAIQYVPAPKHA